MSASDIRLVVFDMDGTLLPGTTAAQEISREAGTLDAIVALETAFGRSEIDSMEFSKIAMKMWLAAGNDVFGRAWKSAPKLAGIEETLHELSNQRVVTCLITMAPIEFAENFTGIDHVFGSNYGKSIINPGDKPMIVKMLANDLGIDTNEILALGDSHSDVPLFNALEHTIAVNGTEEIEELARYTYRGADLRDAISLALPAGVRQ